MPPTKQNIHAEKNLSQSHRTLYSHRERFTLAQLNAGATILLGSQAHKIRIVDVQLIAIGGAAVAATAVIITGVQAGVTVSLLSTAIAALTQNTVNYPGLANNTVLAGGASFSLNDLGTPISLAKTGAAMTTLTHLDVSIDYVLEKA